MKTVFWHGLGQRADDWKDTIRLSFCEDTDCPELFSLEGDNREEDNSTYTGLLDRLEKRYEDTAEPFRICGLSLGGILALDYAIRHTDKVASLVLIGAQYKVPTLLIDFQNLLFRCMPGKAFEGTGLSKQDMIKLSHSMRSLDFSRRLSRITCPAVVVCGEKDTANRKAAERLREKLPQAKLHIIPGAGHEVNTCAPEAVAAILKMG